MSENRSPADNIRRMWMARLGWAAFAGAVLFWLFGMYLSPTVVDRANVTMLPVFRIKMTYFAAAVQIAAAAVALVLLAPYRRSIRRRRPMRDWALRLFLMVIMATGLFHFVLLHRMGV